MGRRAGTQGSQFTTHNTAGMGVIGFTRGKALTRTVRGRSSTLGGGRVRSSSLGGGEDGIGGMRAAKAGGNIGLRWGCEAILLADSAHTSTSKGGGGFGGAVKGRVPANSGWEVVAEAMAESYGMEGAPTNKIESLRL